MNGIPQPQHFTLTWKGRASALLTKCGVTHAFDPLKVDEHPDVNKANGLWDTGATGTVIDVEFAQKLDLKPKGKTKVRNTDGESMKNKYAINLFLPNQVAFKFVNVTEGVLGDIDILIGMDIITTGDFAITHHGGKTTFSFSMPSSHHIDFKKAGRMPKLNPFKDVGRNDPCPCGSGKKFKHCHGKKT